MRISLKDIAAAAGVHYSTASLALRDSPKLPRETRERIQAVAEKMGYRPDPALSALNAYRKVKRHESYQSTLAVVSDNPAWMRYHTGAAQLRGLKVQAERLGYNVETFIVDARVLSASRLGTVLYSRGISGLMISPMSQPHTILDLPWERFSCVASGYSLEKPEVYRVMSAHYRNGMRCLQHLYKCGYRRIGYAMLRSVHERVGLRYGAAYDTFCREHPEVMPLPFFLPENYEREYTPKKVLAWIRRHRIDAVFNTHENDLMQWLPELGVRIPEDVALINASTPSRDGPQTGVFENNEIIGRTMVNTLVGMMHRDERGLPEAAILTMVDGEWVEGATVGRRESKLRQRSKV